MFFHESNLPFTAVYSCFLIVRKVTHFKYDNHDYYVAIPIHSYMVNKWR